MFLLNSGMEFLTPISKSQCDNGLFVNPSGSQFKVCCCCRSGASSKHRQKSIKNVEKEPAVVYFPTNEDAECGDAAAGGGFNTFGFLAAMLAAYNLIGAVTNANQNNNDNNSNNDNNNNLQNVNEATTDTEGGASGGVNLPPLPPGRMLGRARRNTGCGAGRGGKAAVAGLVTAWLRVAAGHHAGAGPGCAARAVCQANWEARGGGGRDTAELGTLVLASRLPRLPRLPPAPDIVWAGRLGRKYTGQVALHSRLH